MKKWLSLWVCVLLLLSLTACGKKAEDKAATPTTTTTKVPAAPVDEVYEEAMAKLAEGNLTEAYALFKKATDPKAAAQMEKFAFVPTTVTCEDSKGADYTTTYTYDERGNLLEGKSLGSYSWNNDRNIGDRYTYDEQGRQLSHVYWDGSGFTYTTLYTFDEAGNEILYESYENDDLTSRTVSTYDERGNLLTEKHYTEYEQDESYDAVYTYDAQNRLLTSDITTESDHTIRTYTYAEDGSYQYSYVGNEKADGKPLPYTYTCYYDKEDRLLGYKCVGKDGMVYEMAKTRYGADGNEIYDYSLYAWPGRSRSETIREDILNEKGETILSQRIEDGEIVHAIEYDYDERGNMVYMNSSDSKTLERTYDEQNRLLTQKETWVGGWENTTYTYDAAGNCIKKEWESSQNSGTVDYTYDQWGNPLTAYRCDKNESYVSSETAAWELRYYPDGVPNTVRYVINEADDITW